MKISNITIAVDGGKPVFTVEGDEHCFEKYTQDISVRAWEKGKDKEALKPYAGAKSRAVARVGALDKKDTDIVPVEIRASFLVSEMLKELLKAVQADKIIKEIIEIKKLTLYFRPVHVFNYTHAESGKTKTICVDAIIGDVYKPDALLKKLKGVRPSEDNFFDMGSGIVDSILPGAGFGVLIGKKIRDYRKGKKVRRQMEASKVAAGEN